jgi:sugar phosphate isomerase/epimerase
MRLGIFTATLCDRPLEEALDTIRELGVETMDFSTGGYGPTGHCDPQALLADEGRLQAFRGAVASRGLSISALCFYGNPLHPDRDLSLAHRRGLRDTIRLAGRLGLDRVVTVSGCPGDSHLARFPNWVTYPWPVELTGLRQWQWEHHLLPFWSAEAAFAVEHGVARLCLEMHAVNAVYNPETLLELRRLVGDAICASLNPGHLYWQRIELAHAIRALGDAVAYVHATDSHLDPLNAPAHGVLDAKPFYYEHERYWSFCTVGYGHGESAWRQMMLALRLAGYDDVISIAHEDTMLLPVDGLRKSLGFLRPLIVPEPLPVPEPPPVPAY